MATVDEIRGDAGDVSEEISRGVKLSWGTGALGVAILMNAVAMFVLFYMVGILKIEPALAGALIFVSKIFDVLTDPIIGGWSDRLNTRRSRRRPFLFVGAFVASISLAIQLQGIYSSRCWFTHWVIHSSTFLTWQCLRR